MADELQKMDNQSLIALHHQVSNDLEQAAESDCNSEWHQSCFAAAVLVCQEMRIRGIDLRNLH